MPVPYFSPNRRREVRWRADNRHYVKKPSNLSYSRNITSEEQGVWTIQNSSINGQSRTSGSSLKSKKIKTATGGNTDGFRKKRRLSQLPVNPYNALIVNKTGSYGSITTHARYAWWEMDYKSVQRLSGYIESFFPSTNAIAGPDGEMIARCQRQAASNLLSQVKDQKVNIAQMIAERNQTIGMLAQAVTKVAEIINAIKAKDLRKVSKAVGLDTFPEANLDSWTHASSRRSERARKKRKYRDTATQVFANNHLAVTYGLQPLISDVYGLAEQLANQLYAVARGSAKAGAFESMSFVKRENLNGVMSDVFYTHSVGVKTGCHFTADGQVAPSLGQVGLTNPAMLAWEMLPWSFVFDWFVPLGDYLNNIDATMGLTFQHGYETIYIKSTRFAHSYGLEILPDKLVQRNIQSSIEQIKISRSKMLGFPNALLLRPAIKNPCSTEHIANALALLFTGSNGNYKPPK